LDTEATDTLEALRERVSEVDRAIVDAINRRIELVHLVWAHKREHGLDEIDPERERWLHEHLAAQNRGPLSREGLEELYAAILDLTKREVGRAQPG
jgi:3-deoxy-7-phosphoheptulonate synthase/chorismate mutase